MAVLLEDWQHAGFGLYIHWPFCESKCPYCDFNSHVKKTVNQAEWAKAYCSEIERIGLISGSKPLKSIYFGGGTPSLMHPDTVNTILTKVRETWALSNNVEITLEANPTSVEAGRFVGYKDAGVNRISMGVQALNDLDLRKLGRRHTVSDARSAFDIAGSIFERINFDLIYARQDQSLEQWRLELTDALKMSADHLSLYQLTVENGTAFGNRLAAGGLHGLPQEDLAADLYDITQELTDKAGFKAYEISNHAKPGSESRHNLIYWQAGDYAGVGPGAHGRLTINNKRFATEAISAPNLWLSAVENKNNGELPHTPMSNNEHADEYLMMGLRITSGIDIARYGNISKSNLNSGKINYLTEIGMVEIRNNLLMATPQGRPLLNAIIRELLTE